MENRSKGRVTTDKWHKVATFVTSGVAIWMATTVQLLTTTVATLQSEMRTLSIQIEKMAQNNYTYRDADALKQLLEARINRNKEDIQRLKVDLKEKR